MDENIKDKETLEQSEVQENCENEKADSSEKPKKEKAPRIKKADLEKAQAERDEYLAALIRERADFENYKKRNATAVSRAFSDGKADAVAAMLPVIDNFERALAVNSSDEAYKNGVELIYKQLTDAIKAMGVEEIDALGKPFDPNFQNAVMQVPCEEGEESGIVKTVLLKGYKIADKVLRHAMVQVTE